jgi:hypothetical protein
LMNCDVMHSVNSALLRTLMHNHQMAGDYVYP